MWYVRLLPLINYTNIAILHSGLLSSFKSRSKSSSNFEIIFFSGTTAYLADLERTDNKMYTPLPVQIGTSFFLHVTFSGTYPHGCGFNFYIKDTTSIYVADFRLNYRGMYKQLLQDYQTNIWMAASVESLELKAGTNNVEIKVNGDFFRVWVNGVQFQVVVSVDPDRLSKYSHFEVGQPLPSCVSVDLQKSFVDFASKYKYHLEMFRNISYREFIHGTLICLPHDTMENSTHSAVLFPHNTPFQSPVRREHTDQLIRQAVRCVLGTLSVQREPTPALLATQDF